MRISSKMQTADDRQAREIAQSVRGTAVEFDNVQRCFGSVVAVDRVTLSVRAGEFFTLLGSSGSGKTTLLHLLAGFQEPDQGEIRLDGRIVSCLPPFKRDIGVVFQSYALFTNMTVFENIAFPLRVRRIARDVITEKVRRALELVQLRGLEERSPSQLSGGQQQRVAFARAIVFEPRLLLMDEPLSALDAKLRRTMRIEIKELQRQLGVTVIYVTHDQDEALALSDRIAVMSRGAVEQIDTPDRLYEHPSSRFVADFLGEANIIEGVVRAQVASDCVEVAVGPNLIRACTPAVIPEDTEVAIAIRPERITINPTENLPTIVEGTVMAAVYGGDHALVRVSVAGATISIKRPVNQGAPPPVGSAVKLGWCTEHATALTR
jgi:putative spermidine/putrescine transport system ATP-binding protein